MPIEALELGEEPDVEGVPIEDADGVVRISGGDETVAGIGDRVQVTWRDEAGDTGDREVFIRVLSKASRHRRRRRGGGRRRIGRRVPLTRLQHRREPGSSDAERVMLLDGAPAGGSHARSQRGVRKQSPELLDPFAGGRGEKAVHAVRR